MSAEFTIQGVYHRVKTVIATEKNWGEDGWKRVFATQVLQDPPLRFTSAGQRGLTPRLNEEFDDVPITLSRDAVGECETVRKLFELVYSKIPNDRKQ